VGDSGGVCQTRPCTLSGPWSAGSGADTRADNQGAERQCPPLACESRGRTSRAAVFQPAPHHHPVAPTQRGPSLATAKANGKGRRCARLSKQLHRPAVLGRLSRLAVLLPCHRVAPAGPGLTGTLRWPAQWACRAGAACAPPDLGRWLKPPGRAVFPSPSRRSCLAVARVAVRPATSVGLLPWAAAYLVIASGRQAGTRAGGRGAGARAGGPARRPAAALRRRRLPPRSLAPIPPPPLPPPRRYAAARQSPLLCWAGGPAPPRRAAPRTPGPAIVASFADVWCDSAASLFSAEASGLTVSPSCRSRSAELPRCHAGGGRPAARARPFPSSVAGKHLSYAYQVTPRADSAAGDNFVFQIAGGAGKEAETTKQVPRLSLGVIPRHQRECPCWTPERHRRGINNCISSCGISLDFSCFSLLTFFHCWFFTAGLLTFFDAPAALLLFLFFFPTTILFFFAMLMQH